MNLDEFKIWLTSKESQFSIGPIRAFALKDCLESIGVEVSLVGVVSELQMNQESKERNPKRRTSFVVRLKVEEELWSSNGPMKLNDVKVVILSDSLMTKPEQNCFKRYKKEGNQFKNHPDWDRWKSKFDFANLKTLPMSLSKKSAARI